MPERRGAALLVILGLVLSFSFLGSHGLFEPSEGRYAEVAREMLVSGNYLEPTLDGHAHWTKPPLAYWASAAGMQVLGRNAWGARFAGALAFFLTTLAVAGIGARLWDRRTGYLAGLIYTTALLPVLAAAVLTTDNLLALWEVLAVGAFIMHRQSGGRRWVRGMWIFFGLGFFTKGPPALLPLVPILVFAAGNREARRVFDPLGVLAFVVVAFWWYVVVSMRSVGLMTYFLRDEVLGRSLTDEFNRNPQWYGPLVVYVPAFLFGVGPWIVEVLRGTRRALAQRHETPVWGERSSPRRLLVLWVALPLAILSLSKSRLPLYVLPLMAPMALLTAATVRRASARRVAAIAVTAVVLGMAVRASMPLVDRHQNAKRIHDTAVALGGTDARYALLDEPRLYGVQFYFDGDIERVSIAAGDGRGNIPLSAAVDSLAAPTVFITNDRGAAALAAALDRAGLSHRELVAEGRRYVVADR